MSPTSANPDSQVACRDTRTCANCSHLRTEHAAVKRPVLSRSIYVRGECDCCRCPGFIPEPDDEAAA